MDRKGRLGNGGDNASFNTALTAVALQDHLMRNFSGSLSLSNPLGKNRSSLAARIKPQKIVARAVVDTGRSKSKKNSCIEQKEPVEKEYVLDAKPPQATLAQKLGLVEAPRSLLSETEWQQVKETSDKRQHFKEPCVICKEDLGTQEQVLLSCTHTFHLACLQAFERFTGRKCCPMCRKEQYQSRVVHEGTRHYRHKCATRIQALWRGYVVRQWYKKLRESIPPKDPKLRKKFYEEKLHSITERMIRSCDSDVGTFLTELDRDLEASRNVFKQFDLAMKVFTDEDWEKIQLKAVERGHTDCPICLTALDNFGLVDDSAGDCKSSRDRSCARQSALLSCSHVFHKACLEAFEEFSVGERQNVCPVCRTSYQKKVL